MCASAVRALEAEGLGEAPGAQGPQTVRTGRMKSATATFERKEMPGPASPSRVGITGQSLCVFMFITQQRLLVHRGVFRDQKPQPVPSSVHTMLFPTHARPR